MQGFLCQDYLRIVLVFVSRVELFDNAVDGGIWWVGAWWSGGAKWGIWSKDGKNQMLRTPCEKSEENLQLKKQ